MGNTSKEIIEDFRFKKRYVHEFLYHGFSIVGYLYVGTEHKRNAILAYGLYIVYISVIKN
jgi:hypothetical protein